MPSPPHGGTPHRWGSGSPDTLTWTRADNEPTPASPLPCSPPSLVPLRGLGRALTEREKKLFRYMVFSKMTAFSSYVQPWLVAIGGWRLVEIAGWRLAAVGGSWRQLAVGDGLLVAVGSG